MHAGRTLGVDRLSSPAVQKHDDACFALRTVMKPLLFALCAVFAFAFAFAFAFVFVFAFAFGG